MPFDAKRGRYVHPAPDPGSRCDCGRAAVARCDGCGGNFCDSCWSHHSHTLSPTPRGWTGNRKPRVSKHYEEAALR